MTGTREEECNTNNITSNRSQGKQFVPHSPAVIVVIHDRLLICQPLFMCSISASIIVNGLRFFDWRALLNMFHAIKNVQIALLYVQKRKMGFVYKHKRPIYAKIEQWLTGHSYSILFLGSTQFIMDSWNFATKKVFYRTPVFIYMPIIHLINYFF